MVMDERQFDGMVPPDRDWLPLIVISLVVVVVAMLGALLLVQRAGDSGDAGSTDLQSAPEQDVSESVVSTTAPPTTAAPAVTTTVDPVIGSELAFLCDPYAWTQPGLSETQLEAVRGLQEFLEIDSDGLYGLGTRKAHLAALEEAGFPTDCAPTCDLVINADLCGVTAGAALDVAMGRLIGGLGEPTQDLGDEWFRCDGESQTAAWGPVVVEMIRSGPEDTEPEFLGWSVSNTWTGDDWEAPFPAPVLFPEANHLVGDHYERELSGTIIPAGNYVIETPAQLEELIGVPMQRDEVMSGLVLYTDKYEIRHDPDTGWWGWGVNWMFCPGAD